MVKNLGIEPISMVVCKVTLRYSEFRPLFDIVERHSLNDLDGKMILLLTIERIAMINLCQGPECARPIFIKKVALCKSHYQQHWRGCDLTPLPIKKSYASDRHGYVHRTYNITQDRYEQMLSDQGGTCAACPTTPEDLGCSLFIDHDHSCCPGARSCGQCVRGLLCNACNSTLGYAKDDVERLSRLIDYLRSR